ncbi:MFS transporter [Candidatus Saccharibacteria bacterium]|jgi:EmrB/QacA subfamily drug resistance transporter|nr:MFS transporter [Candidatus Saccharibacteria bacterium]HPW47767.1 MFS transporter [Candidatus Saccharibacteria bacterium]
MLNKLIKKTNRKWWILGTVCFALLMIVLDGNVVNLAIPSIIDTFNASISQVEWVNNAYLLVFAVFLITFGRLGDEFGRKKLFIIGLIVFVLGSMLCGISNSINQLIFFRCLQGFGGAAMMPATLSLITVSFKAKERGVALGLWGAVAGVSIVLGPIIGGLLTEHGLGLAINNFLGISEFWRYVFYINLPIGITAIVATLIIIPESRDREKKHPVDFLGILLSGFSILLLTFAFIEGAKYGWWQALQAFSLFGWHIKFGNLSIVPVLFVLSIVFGILFFIWEKYKKHEPLVNIELFKERNYKAGNAVTAILSFAMMGSFFLLPLFLQLILGLSPAKTGQYLIPLAVTIIMVAPLSGRLADKLGPRYLAFSGLLVMSIGLYIMSHFTINTSAHDLVLPFVIVGLGMGLIQAPISSAVLKNVPEDKAGGASGVVTTIRQIGSIMGIAVLGAVLQSQMISSFNKSINQMSEVPTAMKTQISQQVSAGNAFRSSKAMQRQLNYALNQQLQKAVPLPDLSELSPAQKDVMIAKVQSRRQVLAKQFGSIGQKINMNVKKSFMDSLGDTLRMASLITLFGAGVSLFLQNPQKRSKQAVVIKG